MFNSNEDRLYRSVAYAQARRWEVEDGEDGEPIIYCCDICKTELEKRTLSDLCESCEESELKKEEEEFRNGISNNN